MRTFNTTREALKVYDAGATARDKAWKDIDSNEDVEACQKLDADALKLVQEAFYEDTKDINNLDNCYRVDIGFMRKMANTY